VKDQIILGAATPYVLRELRYLIDEVEHDAEDWPHGYTLADAFEDFASVVEENGDASQRVRRNIKQIHIALGDAVAMSDDEIARTISTGKAYWFMLDGKKYKFAG